MPFPFRKMLGLGGLVRLNVSTSVSAGIAGASINLPLIDGTGRPSGTLDIRGTGPSYRAQLTDGRQRRRRQFNLAEYEAATASFKAELTRLAVATPHPTPEEAEAFADAASELARAERIIAEAKRQPAGRVAKRLLQGVGIGAFLVTGLILLEAFARAEPLPVPKPLGPGGSCPHGYYSSGSFCVPSQGAQDAVAKPPNGTCPFGWTASGSYCLRSGRR